jgi:hypothetical protein
MADVCSVESCTFHAKYDCKCALHYCKSDYQSDKYKGVLGDFYELLIQYIFTGSLKNRFDLNITFETFKEYIEGKDNEYVESALRSSTTIINDLYFPEFSVQDSRDFTHILKRLKNIQFSECDFATSRIDLDNIEVYFFSCEFHQEYTVSNLGLLLDGIAETLYYDCHFQKKVSFIQSEFDHPKTIYSAPIFGNCNFKGVLEVNRVSFEGTLFNNDKLDSAPDGDMVEFHIYSSVFNDKFMFNRYKFDLLVIEDCTFKNKVELKQNLIKMMVINNSNFEALFDAYESEFQLCTVKKSIFEGFTGFEKCLFGKYDDSKVDKVEFEYVTFLSFTNFRKAKFFNGLDFENTNLKEYPNFLDAEINFKNTNRETYRIIKHSFDKIGNQIEANKYFAYEMKKYKDELEESGSRSELIIYRLNDVISNFGASYLKPAALMFVFAFTYYLLVLGYEDNVLYQFNDVTNINIDWFATQMNLFAKGIPLYGKLLKEGMEFVTLLFHIIFLTCTWQFIVAVKRRTKR